RGYSRSHPRGQNLIGRSRVTFVLAHAPDPETGKPNAPPPPPCKVPTIVGRSGGTRFGNAVGVAGGNMDLAEPRRAVVRREECSPEGRLRVKDKDARVVAICRELYELLRAEPYQRLRW